MMNAIAQRQVARVDNPQVQSGMGPGHRVRPLVPMGNWAASDPFLGLMEDWFPRETFGPHPHRGIETVTFVIDGAVEHRDSFGNSGIIRPGDAQWMTAGRGLLHIEAPPEGILAHTLQLWVNLPAAGKMTEPRYQDLIAAELPVRREPGAEVRVYSGASGEVVSATKNHVPVTMLRIALEPGAGVRQEIPGGYNAFLVVLDGDGEAGPEQSSTALHAGEVAWLTRGDEASEIRVSAAKDGPLTALLFAGPPLKEPVVAHGPFVMNTESQIRQAFADYRAGLFGRL